jgi:hypothetical protein
MLPEEFSRELNDLRAKVADVDADVRVTKHAVANLQMSQTSLGSKIDKMEEKLGGKIDNLTAQINVINTTQARGLGFFAGSAFIITACGGVLIAVAKFIFGVSP